MERRNGDAIAEMKATSDDVDEVSGDVTDI